MSLAATRGAALSGPAERGWRSRVQDPVPWVVGLFLATFLLQRIATPGLPVPVTVPLAVVWLGAVLALGVVELSRTRLPVWLFAAGISGLMVVVQILVVVRPYISVNSWALWLVTWLPLVVQLRRRDLDTYRRCVRALARVGLGLAVLSLSFLGVQLAGFRYYDWLGTVVPPSLLVQDYVIAYPIVYGSPLYKSNGWIALEPSFMSFFLGVTLICAFLARVKVVHVLVIAAGLLSTVAGSGLALVLVFLLALGVRGQLAPLRRYLVPLAAVAALFGTTVFGGAILSRLTEVGTANSSTSLRSIQPYVQLWPSWVSDPAGIFVGHGPGSSAVAVINSGIDGLLVPSLAKVLYDYGLLGGAALVVLMVLTYLRAPSSAFAVSLAASMFVLQAASQPLVICSILLLALWSPPLAATALRRPLENRLDRASRPSSTPGRRPLGTRARAGATAVGAR